MSDYCAFYGSASALLCFHSFVLHVPWLRYWIWMDPRATARRVCLLTEGFIPSVDPLHGDPRKSQFSTHPHITQEFVLLLEGSPFGVGHPRGGPLMSPAHRAGDGHDAGPPRQRPHPQRPMLTTRCRSLCQPELNLSCAAPPLQGARHLLYCIPRFPLGWPARRRPPHLLGPMTRGYGSLQPGIVSRASAEQVNRDRKVCYPGTRVPLADSFRCRPNPRPLVQRWRSL